MMKRFSRWDGPLKSQLRRMLMSWGMLSQEWKKCNWNHFSIFTVNNTTLREELHLTCQSAVVAQQLPRCITTTTTVSYLMVWPCLQTKVTHYITIALMLQPLGQLMENSQKSRLKSTTLFWEQVGRYLNSLNLALIG